MATRKPKSETVNTDTADDTTKDDNTKDMTEADKVQTSLEQAKAEGFQTVAPAELNYYKVQDKDGNMHELRGIPLKRKPRPDNGDSYYYIFGVTADCVLYDREGNAVPTEGGPESYAWVDERHDLLWLQEYLPKKAEGQNGQWGIVQCCEVIIRPKKKIKVGGNRTMWTFEKLARIVKPDNKTMPMLAPATSAPPSPPKKDNLSDIPF